MKLIFSKEDDNEPEVKLAKGTVPEDFSYIEFVKGLLEGEDIELTFGDNISSEEEAKLEAMVERINTTIQERLEMEQT